MGQGTSNAPSFPSHTMIEWEIGRADHATLIRCRNEAYSASVQQGMDAQQAAEEAREEAKSLRFYKYVQL